MDQDNDTETGYRTCFNGRIGFKSDWEHFAYNNEPDI